MNRRIFPHLLPKLLKRWRKRAVGRPKGWRATTKAEDKEIVKAFKKVRPPGHGVSARKVRSALPKKLKKKVRERTVIRRLADKSYNATGRPFFHAVGFRKPHTPWRYPQAALCTTPSGGCKTSHLQQEMAAS